MSPIWIFLFHCAQVFHNNFFSCDFRYASSPFNNFTRSSFTPIERCIYKSMCDNLTISDLPSFYPQSVLVAPSSDCGLYKSYLFLFDRTSILASASLRHSLVDMLDFIGSTFTIIYCRSYNYFVKLTHFCRHPSIM